MLIAGEMVNMVGSLMMERVRPVVGFKGWDYCVVWKLTEDQRFLEWMDCCCAGGGQNGGEELLFHVPSCVLPCRDAMVQHPRTKSCDLLAQLPSSISLDSGIHGQTLVLNQPRWLNYCNSSDSSILEETVGTGLLIPVLGGLIELFVAKQVAEDQHVIDFVTTQWHMIISMEEMMNSSNMDSIFSGNVNESSNAYGDQNDHFQAPISSLTAVENSKDLPSDRSAKRIRLCASPLNFLDHDYVFLEGISQNSNQDGDHKNSSSNKPTADSVSECSEQIDDHDDEEELLKYRRKTGKGAPSKNIDAERRRRKKLNDRLYTLRSLVPKISKLDRASILGDAIEFVKELQKQAKDLQDELEENSEEEDEESGKIINPGIICSNSNDLHYEIPNDNNGGPVVNIAPQTENKEVQTPSNGVFATAGGACRPTSAKQEETDKIADEKARQMEPQVEVALIEGNEFYVNVFCEHRAGGFVRLMEALSSLGLEVSNANVTVCKGLVSNAFKVEQKRDCEMVQAHHVRDSLLQLTKNPSGRWPDRMPYSSENGDSGSGGFNFNHPHHHTHSHLFSSHHLHHLQN